jgi:hypothetical protein
LAPLGEGERVSMLDRLELVFPRLRDANYRISSSRDDVYNCIAWAAGFTDAWWWPGTPDATFWPDGIPREVTLQAFSAAFASLGYSSCISEEPELGFEKIALYANAEGLPCHAARQLPSGRWTSKLGKMEDIEHSLHDLAGTIYGSVVQVMKRAAPQPGGGQLKAQIVQPAKEVEPDPVR